MFRDIMQMVSEFKKSIASILADGLFNILSVSWSARHASELTREITWGNYRRALFFSRRNRLVVLSLKNSSFVFLCPIFHLKSSFHHIKSVLMCLY